MDHSKHSGHGVIHMVVGCGLMLVAILLLPSFGGGWASAVVPLAFLVCPLMMLFLMRGSDGRAAEGGDHREHQS
jgi:hypothetical protein